MKKIIILIMLVFLSINSGFSLEEGMSVSTLPSGQKVVIKEVKDNNIVKIDTWINTGSINEDDKTTGISHFLEHLFFKGTQKHPTGEMDKILDSKGAVVNAGTSKDFTHYYIEIPSKDFDLALSLHADMLQNPLIPRKELERERSVVIEEISKTKDSPQNLMFDNMYKLLYEKSNHPYKRNVIGEKEVIETVTREEIFDYLNRFYTPDAYTTVIVGDVNKEDALKKVAEAFNQKQPKKQEKIKYPKIKPLDKIERKTDTMDISKSYLMIGFLAPKFSDLKDNYALDVLASILGSGKSSILNQELKEKLGLVLSVSAGNFSQKDSGMFYINSSFDPKNEKCIEEAILKEIEKIQQGELDESLITKTKNMIKTDTYYSRESISNISDELGYIYTLLSDGQYWEDYLKNIDKVTKRDIVNVARKYLDTNKYAISVVRPQNYNCEIKEISNVKENNIETKLLEEKDNTKKVLLPNGAVLITKKKTSNSIVAINIAIKGSKMVEKKPAAALLSALGAMSGTKNYTNKEFAQYLDENGIKLGLSSSNDSFSIVVQSTLDNLDKAFIALDEVINNPVFSDYELDKIKSRKIQELKGVSDNPSSYVFDEFKKLAYQNSVYGQNAQFLQEAVKNVTRDDVVEFYSKIINPENMAIAVVGNIDENEVAKKINEIIKPNPKGKKFSYSNVKYTSFRPQKNIETTLHKKQVQANWMALGYKTCGTLNRKDIAVLNVINAILGEGMSSRLFRKLREEQGLAYTVGSSISSNVLDGTFIAYIGTNSNSIKQAKEGMMNEIELLKKEMVTTKELNDAKDKIMGNFLLALETNMDEASLLSGYSILGRNLNALDEYKKLIMDVTQSDIIEIANKYFSKPYIYTVVVEEGK